MNANQQKPSSKETESTKSQLYMVSLYIALIDRHFGLSGVVTYGGMLKGESKYYIFDHLASDQPVLVFSKWDQDVCDRMEDIENARAVIIDCKDIELSFEECENCGGSHFIKGEWVEECLDYGVYLLKDGILYEDGNCGNGCGYCWSKRKPILLDSLQWAIHKHIEEACKGIK